MNNSACVFKGGQQCNLNSLYVGSSLLMNNCANPHFPPPQVLNIRVFKWGSQRAFHALVSFPFSSLILQAKLINESWSTCFSKLYFHCKGLFQNILHHFIISLYYLQVKIIELTFISVCTIWILLSLNRVLTIRRVSSGSRFPPTIDRCLSITFSEKSINYQESFISWFHVSSHDCPARIFQHYILF